MALVTGVGTHHETRLVFVKSGSLPTTPAQLSSRGIPIAAEGPASVSVNASADTSGNAVAVSPAAAAALSGFAVATTTAAAAHFNAAGLRFSPEALH